MENDYLAIINMLILKCKSQEIPMIWLRPRQYDEISVFSNDFDFLVDKSEIKNILTFVFKECSARNISFIVENGSTTKITLSILSNNSSNSIQLDLWYFAEFRTSYRHSHFNRASISYKDVANLPNDQREMILAVLYILHLHHKQKLIDDHTALYRIDLFIKTNNLPCSIKKALNNLKGKKACPLEAYNTAIDYLYTNKIKFISPFKLKLIYVGNNIKRLLYLRVPKVVPFIGPDGSGKSTIIDKIKDSDSKKSYSYKVFKRLFRKPLFHIFKSQPRNMRDEKMLWLILPVAWISLGLGRWVFGWIKPMIIDRYFYDYYIYNVRNKNKPLRQIRTYKLCSLLTPRPYKLVICMCRPEVVITRKSEMTIKAINSLYSTYIDQISISMPKKILFCSTGQNLETTMLQTMLFLS